MSDLGKLIKDLPAEEYHALDSLSVSGMGKLLKSPAHYRHYKDEPQDETAALVFGRAFHALVLEPAIFNDLVAVAPEIDRRTKAGKEEYAAFLELAAGKTVISADDMATMRAMAKNISNHLGAKACLTGSGFAEVSALWDENGMPCRARYDWMRADALIVDVKTTQDASPEGFMRSAYQYRYHMQAYWYMRGYERANGEKAQGFVFIAVEKDAPHCVATYHATAEMLELGKYDCERALEIYRQAQESNEWRGYAETIQPLSLPRWAENRLTYGDA